MRGRCAVIVLFLCGIGVFAAPKLSMDKSSVNVGSYPANQPRSCNFTITNEGDETLKITKIRTTCGCAAGGMATYELQPGESGPVTVTLIPESIDGHFSKALFIHSNDPAKSVISVTVSGRAIPLVTVLPQNHIYAGAIPGGILWRQEYLLKTTEPVEWAPIVVSDCAGQVSVELTPIEEMHKDSAREYIFKISFIPEKVEENFKITVKLPIIAPENWKPVELLIQGRTTK